MEFKVAAIAVIRDGDKVLLGRKSPGREPYPDTWRLIGGGMELGKETPEQALKREVLEETGLEIKDIEPIAWDTDTVIRNGKETFYIYLQFTCNSTGGDPKAMDDLKSVSWINISELGGIKLNKPTIKLFRRIGLLKDAGID